MKLYTCDFCGSPLYFENSFCLQCRHVVGFDATSTEMITLEQLPTGEFQHVHNPDQRFQFCVNSMHGVCNWLLPWNPGNTFCVACALNNTIPVLIPENLERWKRIEIAKHRLVYSLIRLNLPLQSKPVAGESGLAFDFLAEISADEKVLTGHLNGTITVNIQEADEAERVRNKLDLGEKYRTLLGHFRHETGHYYWDLLVKNGASLEGFRAHFGDEQQDYSESLKTYYQNGPPSDWMQHYISPYAAAHPWEDWAETWAHYLHMMDTLETAYSFGLVIHPKKVSDEQELDVMISRDPYTMSRFEKVFKIWLPLTFAVNSLNRSMGHSDFYPFIISPEVVEKLEFIHSLCMSNPKKG